MKPRTEERNPKNNETKKYGHKTQVLDTGKVMSDVFVAFFKELGISLSVLFALLKSKVYERTDRKNKGSKL